MNPTVIFTGYFRWYYGKAIGGIFTVWRNFLWFVLHFFSFFLLLKTLFSPWKRLHEDYRRQGFHPGLFFQTLIVNFIMRIVGSIIRSIIIVIALMFLLLVFAAGLLFFIFWIVAPVGVPLMIILGLGLFSF